MKTLVVLYACLSATLVVAQETAAEGAPEATTAPSSTVAPAENAGPLFVRDLPADVLRDFPGLCFASTQCAVKQVGEQWPLQPFCGVATCVFTGDFLVERVQDCGPLPKPNPKCKVTNVNDTAEPFPACCPQFECEEGVELEYPTPVAATASDQPADATSPAAAKSETASVVPPPTETTSEGSTTADAEAA